MAHRYRPGGWPAIVSEYACLVVGPAVDSGLVDRLFRAVNAGADQRSVLDLLDSGGWAPPYALVLRDPDPSGPGQAYVRGELAVELRSESDHLTVDGGGAAGRTRGPLLTAVVRTLVDDKVTGPDLAIGNGVVLVGEVRLSWAARPPGRVTEPVPQPNPAYGVVEFSTGMRIPIEKSLLVGSAPSIHRTTDPDLPKLITVPSPTQQISRTHLAVDVSAAGVLAIDLRSTNGSFLAGGGRPPERMAPDQRYQLRSGDTIDIGDGVVLTFSGLT